MRKGIFLAKFINILNEYRTFLILKQQIIIKSMYILLRLGYRSGLNRQLRKNRTRYGIARPKCKDCFLLERKRKMWLWRGQWTMPKAWMLLRWMGGWVPLSSMLLVRMCILKNQLEKRASMLDDLPSMSHPLYLYQHHKHFLQMYQTYHQQYSWHYCRYTHNSYQHHLHCSQSHHSLSYCNRCSKRIWQKDNPGSQIEDPQRKNLIERMWMVLDSMEQWEQQVVQWQAVMVVMQWDCWMQVLICCFGWKRMQLYWYCSTRQQLMLKQWQLDCWFLLLNYPVIQPMMRMMRRRRMHLTRFPVICLNLLNQQQQRLHCWQLSCLLVLAQDQQQAMKWKRRLQQLAWKYQLQTQSWLKLEVWSEGELQAL